MLGIASLLLIFIGIVHSYLGERYILIRLFKRELPKLFGSDLFTKQVLRFAWHMTTVAWFGFAGILLSLYLESPEFSKITLLISALVFGFSGAMSFAFTKGKHYSYIVFWSVSIICVFAANDG